MFGKLLSFPDTLDDGEVMSFCVSWGMIGVFLVNKSYVTAQVVIIRLTKVLIEWIN